MKDRTGIVRDIHHGGAGVFFFFAFGIGLDVLNCHIICCLFYSGSSSTARRLSVPPFHYSGVGFFCVSELPFLYDSVCTSFHSLSGTS